MGWHDESCRKADIVFFDDGRSCLSCGAVAPECSSSLLPPIRQLAEIRILSLKFGSSSEPIVCDVFTQDLASYPEYEAISYTWADESGDATKSRTIQVAGRSFPVTANCENALRRVRRRFTDRNIWIDAVCIDQDNVGERGHQVGLMPRIYAGAKHVIIYIGESNDKSTAALSSVTHGPIQWKPLLELMSRRYFTRAWTLQEVALARKATLLCGQDSISWELLARRIRETVPTTFENPQTQETLLRLSSQNNLLELSSQLSSKHTAPGNTQDMMSKLPPQLSFDYTLYSSPGHVLTLFDLGRRSQAADPRDKVFSLLGLMPGGRMGDIEADYSMDTCQLYTNVAAYLASQYGWLSVLTRAHHVSITSLPSWVPDWSQREVAPLPELSRPPFHPFVNGICDADEKIFTIKLLALGGENLHARKDRGPPTRSRLNAHWDSYVAQRTQTHLWAQRYEPLQYMSTSCFEFLTYLLEALHLAVDENAYSSIISHQMGFVNLRMDPFQSSIEPNCGEYRFVRVEPPACLLSVCGVPIETAAQIFTLTIAEMVHLDVFAKLGVDPHLPKGLDDETESEESLNRYLEAVFTDCKRELASGAYIDPALGNFWSTKYNAGGLAGVEARNRSILRIISSVDTLSEDEERTYTTTSVTPAEMESGPWSTRHPLFAEANEVLWKLFLHRYLYREVSVKIR